MGGNDEKSESIGEVTPVKGLQAKRRGSKNRLNLETARDSLRFSGMRTDYHIHTPLCQHAVGAPRDYVLAGQAAGLSEIGFADHNPMPTQFDDWRMAPDDLVKYFGLIEEVRKEFPDYNIRLGLECDYIIGFEGHIRHLAQQAEWDYLIGSVHYIMPGWDVDNPKHLKRYRSHPVEDVWNLYFETYTKMIEQKLFDFYAHPDLPKKFGLKPEGDLAPFYKNTIEALADCGGVLEMNTAGLRKEVNEIYPSKQFLEMVCAKNIPIVINSDSHDPKEVAYDFDRAYALAKEVGFETVTRFEKRKAIQYPIQ